HRSRLASRQAIVLTLRRNFRTIRRARAGAIYAAARPGVPMRQGAFYARQRDREQRCNDPHSVSCYLFAVMEQEFADRRRISMPQDARKIDAAAIPLSEIDVSNPQLYAGDAWGQLFARLRREAPVHYCCKSAYGPYWSVTRYNDIMAVELDHATFSSSSEHGGIQIADQPPGAQYGNFIRMDPPRHTAQRKPVAPLATPAHVAKLEGLIRERSAKVLEELPRNETFDWVDKVSIELTTMMLATLFDFPWEDRRLLPYWSDVAVANLDAPDSPVKTQEERVAELTRMAHYFAKLFEERARKP